MDGLCHHVCHPGCGSREVGGVVVAGSAASQRCAGAPRLGARPGGKVLGRRPHVCEASASRPNAAFSNTGRQRCAPRAVVTRAHARCAARGARSARLSAGAPPLCSWSAPDDPAFSCARLALQSPPRPPAPPGGRTAPPLGGAGPHCGREGRTAGSTPSPDRSVWASPPPGGRARECPAGDSLSGCLPWLCRGNLGLFEPQCPHL